MNNRRSGNLDKANRIRVNLTVPQSKSVTEFNFIGVYSSDSGKTLTRIALPSPLHVPPNLNGLYSTILRGTCYNKVFDGGDVCFSVLYF